jgi:hypothetical protein
MWVRGSVVDLDSLNLYPDKDPDPAFQKNPDPRLDQRLKKKIQPEKFKFKFPYPLAYFKDVQATGEAFSPQKRTSSTSKKN